jgi:hypothetical protein
MPFSGCRKSNSGSLKWDHAVALMSVWAAATDHALRQHAVLRIEFTVFWRQQERFSENLEKSR